MERILILIASDSWQDVSAALHSARDNASGRLPLSFGVCLMEPLNEAEQAALDALGPVHLQMGSPSAWQCVEALWQGETYILMSHPAMRFARRWDVQLRAALRQCPGRNWGSCVLTGLLPSPIDPVDAVSPVAAEGFDTAGCLCYHKGTPLRYAKHPMRSAFMNPYFCFGPSAFARGISRSINRLTGTEKEPAFLAAFRAGWHLFTLHRPLIRMEWDLPVLPDVTSSGDPQVIRRFRDTFSVDLAGKTLSGASRLGIFTADMKFPMHVPAPVRWQQAIRAFTARNSRLSPMCVTLKVAGYNRRHMQQDESYVRFSRLTAIKELAVLCFADGENGRRILPHMPNVLEYKSRYGLPVEGELPDQELPAFYSCSKAFLLRQARERFLNHSHYVWIAFDYLRYPVYERSVLDWGAVLTDKIVLAMVNGIPDATMVCVPEKLLSDLCTLTARICAEHRRTTGSLPAESLLWQTLMHEKPEWFDPIELPSRYALLDIVMLSRGEEILTTAE